MPNKKILIVEDDENQKCVVKYNLEKEGFAVSTAGDGVKGLEIARVEKPDLIILDLMLPEMSGLEVCRILRQETLVPIIMLTAKNDEVDKIIGLELGADDYISKPYSMRELIARVRATIRRNETLQLELINRESPPVTTFVVGKIEIDPVRHVAYSEGNTVDLSPKEFDLLVYLARNRGRAFSREALMERVWGYDYTGDTRTVDVHIRWLRQKMEKDPENPRNLITIRGIGYRLE